LAAKDMLCCMTCNSSTQWGARPCARNKHTSMCLGLSVMTSGEEYRRKGEPVDIQPFLDHDVYWIVISSVPGLPREAPKRRWSTDRESIAYEPCTLIFSPNTDHSTSHTLQHSCACLRDRRTHGWCQRSVRYIATALD